MTISRAEFLDQVEKLAYNNEKVFHGCAQAALAALQDSFNRRDDAVFQSASALGGGVGMSCSSGCGAMTGGSIFLSQLCGRERESDGSFGDAEGRRFKAYELSRTLIDRFNQAYGSPNCFEVQKSKFGGKHFALTDSEQFQEFLDLGGHAHVCPEVVGRAARWTAEIILDNLEDMNLEGFEVQT